MRHPAPRFRKLAPRGLGAALCGATLAAAAALPASADDTEIFFGRSSDALDTYPNVLFVLDVSGSMGRTDDGTQGTRMQRMQDAMALLLDQSSSFNVGLMSFQGNGGGATVRYPVGYLESDSGDLCGGICPDETVTARPGGFDDDAVQDDDTGKVDVSAQTLTLGSIVEDAATGVTVQSFERTAVATSDRVEFVTDAKKNRLGTGVDEATVRWFHDDRADGRAARVAYRFDDIDLPPDAAVTNAFVRFHATADANQRGNLGAYIHGEQTADPVPYDDLDPESGRTLVQRNLDGARTSETVSWSAVPPIDSVAPITPGGGALAGATAPPPGAHDTPDIGPILTEIAGLNGWASGNAVSLLFNATDEYVPSPSAVREFHGSAAPAALRPVLHYTFVRAADSEIETRSFAAAAHVDEITGQNVTTISRNVANRTSELFHAGAANEPRRLGLRFDDVDVPADAEILTARLVLRGAPLGSTAPASDWTVDPSTVPATDPADPADPGEPAPAPGPGPEAPSVTEPDVGAAEPGVIVNVAVEQDPTPAPWADAPLAARDYGTDFRAWSTIGETPGERYESPNFAELVTELVARDGWAAGGSMVLALSADPNYANAAENVRLVRTSGTPAAPELEITWRPESASVEAEPVTQTTAVRFRNVQVPPGATIQSAELVFTAAGADDSPTTLEISAEAVGASAPIRWQGIDNDIGDRQRTTARLNWTVPAWNSPGAEETTADAGINLASIVQEVTDRPDWCGGNPLTVFLRGTDDGVRRAHAHDRPPVGSKAPVLRLTYSPSSVPTASYCSNTFVALSSTAPGDDAVQLATGEVRTTGARLDSIAPDGTRNVLGLRFPGLPLEPGTRIVSAALKLSSRSALTDTATLDLGVEAVDDSAAFTNAPGDLSGRAWDFSNTRAWRIDAPVSADEGVLSGDLGPLVQSVVDRAGWSAGNAIAFGVYSREGESARSFHSIDHDEALSARLIVYYETERTDPGTRFRENLKAQVRSFVPGGWTPLVSSLYEAGRYYRGESVEFGARRGESAEPVQQRQRYRTSHRYSYAGPDPTLPPECTADDPSAPACVEERIEPAGSASYLSPIDSECAGNHIVLLSDGAATSNNAVPGIRSMTGLACATPRGMLRTDGTPWANAGAETCGVELAEWLHGTDHAADLPGVQNVSLHTVALALDSDLAAGGYLDELAAAGGTGKAHRANSTSELLGAFQNIFAKVSKTERSFVSPSATLNLQSRFKHDEDVYFSLFRPEATARWTGNLKRYRQGAGANGLAALHGADGKAALTPDGSGFAQDAKSYWSGDVDGTNVGAGGAAAELAVRYPSYLARQVYTWTDAGSDALTDSRNRLAHDNASLDAEWFELAPARLADEPDYLRRVIDWSRGADLHDVDGDGETDDTRGQMGDPLHSQPVVVNYAGGQRVVFVATNEGYLHAIDAETGEELWAFVPKELLRNLAKFHDNEPAARRIYGLDGGLTAWVDDENADGRIDTGERAMLYVGMRRGGDAYYAIDIGSRTAPRYAWSIEGGRRVDDTSDATADGDYEQLGATWSRPVHTRLRDGETVRDVLVFGGGYSPAHDPAKVSTTAPAVPATAAATESSTADGGLGDAPTPRPDDAIGRGVYVVDAVTGDLVWSTPLNDPAYAAMRFAIPSEVKVLDMNFDGLADLMLVGDMGAQLWRFDIDNGASTDDALAERVTGGLIAELGGDAATDRRRFYHPPDVAIINADGRPQLNIGIGSGWRAHPLDTVVEDRFYSIRSRYVYGAPINSTGNVDYAGQKVTESTTGFGDATGDGEGGANAVTDPLAPDPAEVARGWYLRLNDPGEKVLGRGLTANGQVMFTSYRPEAASEGCSPVPGASSLYTVSARDGRPVFAADATAAPTLEGRRTDLAIEGLAPDIGVLFPPDGEATVMIGTQSVPADLGALRRRSFWQERMEGESTRTATSPED